MTRPTIEELDTLPPDAFAAAVAPLFEGAPRFLARLAAARPFQDPHTLFARACAIAHALPEAERLELIDAHPRLGAAPASVSTLSYVEQGYDRGVTDLAAELERLNAAYETCFGFRYCVFVAGRTRAELLPGFEAALAAERTTEMTRALDAVVDIAQDRWHKLATPSGAADGGTMIELGPTRYGKARIRLVKVMRLPDRHVVRDLTVDVALEGDFAAAHTEGDQSLVVATDTMKNTVYALAKVGLTGSIEAFGLTLGRHFLGFEQVARATISIEEQAWAPIATENGPAPDAFVRQGELTRTTVVSVDRAGATVEAGIKELLVMKTAKSAFAGFPRDRFTTLKETDDRILATKVTAAWRYTDAGSGVDFDAAFERVRRTLLTVFAEHFSPAVQTSIWIMGRAVLEAEPAIDEIRFALPNVHHWTYDLSPFGLENDGEIFVTAEDPHGLIEATVRRSVAG